jgi:mono/diheme cytochrome c family protein
MRWQASLAAVACVCLGVVYGEGQEVLTFEQHIRPILKAHCFHCHGEEGNPEAGLDLRQVRRMRAGGDSGPAIVPGDPDQSLLVVRIRAAEMPPPDKGKPLQPNEIALIGRWVAQGAPTRRPEPEQLPRVTDEERQFWAFQPPARPPLPQVRQTEALRTAVDAFLLAELERHGLGLAPPADRATLLRRATLDLTGLPPAPEEVAAFLEDPSPDAWERLLDRLLASPHYGERWGRHWLDVAGYADSDGYTEKDPPRKYAYKYRDYVIRAINADLPWDQFLVAQLAGDELLTPPYENLSTPQADLLAATGFLRMAPDGTGDASVDLPVAQNDVIAETLKIVASGFLGLTVGCAQCHDHRYDPIPQVDYYRLRAIFEPAFDPQHWRRPSERLVSLWDEATRQKAAAIDAELKQLDQQRQAALDQIVDDIFEAELAKLPSDELRALARAARSTPAGQRTPMQQQLLKEHPTLSVSRSSAYLYDRKRVDAVNQQFDERQKALRQQRPAEDYVPCLTEVPGQVPDTHVLTRGDVRQPREVVEPGELSVLPDAPPIPKDDPSLPTSGRRLAYARWLASGQHPLVGRVLVNRFWLLHFGQGIVATPGDFGQLGARPSHPALLDWLATRFVQDGWSLKRLHRLVMGSAAYQQSSQRRADLEALDPENRLLGRMNVRRLEAEAVRDALLCVSGMLERTMGGPPVPVTVDEVGQVIVGLDNRDSAGRPQGKRKSLGAAELRRSIYIEVRRSLPVSMLEAFDLPTLTPNCELRSRSTVAPQALWMMNSEFVLVRSHDLARRVLHEVPGDPPGQVARAWLLALGRPPDASQVQEALEFLADQRQAFAAPHLAADAQPGPRALPGDGSGQAGPVPADSADAQATLAALASFCQALLSSNHFLYVD